MNRDRRRSRDRGPERTCVGCGKRRERTGLLRLVADGRGHLQLDVLKRAAGRGVYVCATPKCIAEACRRSPWSRRLRRGTAAPEPGRLLAASVEALRRQLEEVMQSALQDGRARRGGEGEVRREQEVAWEGIVVHDPKLGRRVAALVEQLGGLEQAAP